MRRRDLFAFGTLALAGTVASATPAAASDPKSAPAEVVPLNIGGVGLPIIVNGRIRNYIFVTVSLTPGPGHTLEQVRAKEPHFRDALVRAAHRTPFVVADDWTVIDSDAVAEALMRVAPSISGAGSIASASVALQSPRRRTGMRPT